MGHFQWFRRVRCPDWIRPKTVGTNRWRAFLEEEDAQATIEYVLMLSVVVGIALMVFRFLKPLFRRWSEAVSKKIDDTLFRGNVHRFDLRR